MGDRHAFVQGIIEIQLTLMELVERVYSRDFTRTSFPKSSSFSLLGMTLSCKYPDQFHTGNTRPNRCQSVLGSKLQLMGNRLETGEQAMTES